MLVLPHSHAEARIPSAYFVFLAIRRADGLLVSCARRTRRRRRVREVTRLKASKLLLVQLGCRGSGHCLGRMCLNSAVRRSLRMAMRRRRLRCCCPRSRGHPRRRRSRRWRVWRVPWRPRPRQIVHRRGGTEPPRGGDARASTRSCAGTRAVSLCRDRRGDRERSHDRDTAQEMLHHHFWILCCNFR
jgi:hypothetical protein